MTKQITYLPITFGQDMENQEIAYFSQHFCDLPLAEAQHLGAGFRRIGGGAAMRAAAIDMPAFNRLLGLGLEAPITGALLDEATDWYRSAGAARFFIPLSKMAERPAVVRLLESRGFHHYNNWAKLYRPVRPAPVVETELRIVTAGARQREAFAEVLLKSFEWSEALRPLLANPLGRPGWKHYLAYDGETPVAAAALYIRGRMASMAFAGTLPEYRGRGAQSALIARRLQDAAEAGCRWALVETAQDKPERPVSSFRNLRRLGFELAYLRPNYLSPILK